MRFLSVLLLALTANTLALELNLHAIQELLVPRQDTTTSRSANTQTSIPTASGTVPSAVDTTTRTANTEVSQPIGTTTAVTTETTSATRSANTNVSGPTTNTPTASAGSTMVAVAAPLRTNDVRWPAACVGLAAVAIGMGML